MEDSFLLFAAVGFLAQLVDGALGMAYGIVASSVLLSFGVTPAAASASTHFAELFTTGASASSHIWHRNVNWRLLAALAPAGVVGGLFGTYVLTSVDGAALRPYVAGYLALMGSWILYRALFLPILRRQARTGAVIPLGGIGGFMDAVGGGGWGPTVSTALIGSGNCPRETIGTVNTAEFMLTVAVSAAFLAALVSGHWAEAGGMATHAAAVAGLIVGGVLAAPLAGRVVQVVPARTLMLMVGVLICILAAWQISRL